MSDENPDAGATPRGRTADLHTSVNNLLDWWGSTTDIRRGILINLALAATGIIAYYYTTGWVSYIGLAWAALNLSGIIKWVFNL